MIDACAVKAKPVDRKNAEIVTERDAIIPFCLPRMRTIIGRGVCAHDDRRGVLRRREVDIIKFATARHGYRYITP